MKRFTFALAGILTLTATLPLEAHPIPENTITVPGAYDGDFIYIVRWWGTIITLEQQLPRKNGIASRQWEFHDWESSDSTSIIYMSFVRWNPGEGPTGSSIEILVPRNAVPFTGKAMAMHGLTKRIVCWYRPYNFPWCQTSAP